MTEMGQGLHQLRHIAKTIRENDQQAAPVNLRHELVKNFGQLRFAARLGFLQCLQNNPQMTRPRPGGDVVAHFLVERHQPNTVCLPQQQVR